MKIPSVWYLFLETKKNITAKNLNELQYRYLNEIKRKNELDSHLQTPSSENRYETSLTGSPKRIMSFTTSKHWGGSLSDLSFICDPNSSKHKTIVLWS